MVGLQAFLNEYADEAAEVTWLAGLTWIERAACEGRERRFRVHPRGELRRLRRSIAPGLSLVRFAVALQEEHRVRGGAGMWTPTFRRELDEQLRLAAAAEVDAQRRRRNGNRS